MRRRAIITLIGSAGLAAVVGLAGGCAWSSAGVDPVAPTVPTTAAPGATTTTAASSETTATTGAPTTTTTTSIPAGPVAPPPGPRYVVPESEVEADAKQLACDIAYALTTYEEADDPAARLTGIAGTGGLALLTEASEPLTHPGQWSRGEIVYPQLGGLANGRTSVMVVTRQTVGSGADPEYSVVRTLDIRLARGGAGWEFDALASAGGVFEDLEHLTLAHAVASDPRIEMPDSARLDILAGEVSPLLLRVMSDIADITPYGVTVMATGHPYHVFETTRVSHHSIGRAIDIYRVGDRHVIDDRAGQSASRSLVQWLWENSRVIQVGSPWDVDGGGSKRSFDDIVHQDHIHVAVIGPGDADWVPAIGNLVWEDLDGDGIQDRGEPGIRGVTVRLYDEDGARVGSTTTGADGTYSFRNLFYGQYHVEVDIPAGFVASPRDQGSSDGSDSDINGSGVMAVTMLEPRENDTTWDAGLYRRGSIGDLVWEDLDGDGIQDRKEPGLEGVTVRLFDASGARVASTVTDADGAYLFDDLLPGTYHVEVEIPDGWVASPMDQDDPGDDDAIDPDTLDSDIDDEGVADPIVLHSGEDHADLDAGLFEGASIGDLVWEDLDRNGIQDHGEPGLGGVTVRLFDRDGNRVAATRTNADGHYRFTDLVAGTYHVEIVIPGGYAATRINRGYDEATDSDIRPTGVMAATRLDPGEYDPDWDAGLRPTTP